MLHLSREIKFKVIENEGLKSLFLKVDKTKLKF